ncbi:MAG: hypothetical protein NZV14_16340 [Bryobacteraceae bacterium]|nr:hypothetical protein [Bryobacteraceae bacterium]MDW8379732.1 hypothetical protein [Bryobacterales bacterium]
MTVQISFWLSSLRASRQSAGRLVASLFLSGAMLAAGDNSANSPAAESPLRRNVLTNQGVVLLAQAGYTETFVIDIIHHKQTSFDVSAEGLAWLARNGLSERIVRAMVANARKEENTAILPATVQLAPPGTPASSPPARNLTPGYVPDWAWSRKAGPAQSATEALVQLAIPVAFPSPPPSHFNWYLRAWVSEPWYVLPRMP